jgi:hypothetical protein
MDLQLRWEANEAKKAYVAAMNKFKETPPEIAKNKAVSFGTTSYSHATLDHVCEQVTEGLSKVGISHRWNVHQSDGVISVTCVLTHLLGHSEETTLSGCPDTSGSKNAIQAVGSTVTYLERYSLLAATGLAAANSDNDGAGEPVFEKLQEFLDSIATAPNFAILEKTYKDAFVQASKSGKGKALPKIIAAKSKRKAELESAQ